MSLSLWTFQWSNGHPSKFMFEVHFSISDNICTMSLGSSFFFPGAFITNWLKRFTFHFFRGLKLPLNRPLDTKGMACVAKNKLKKFGKSFLPMKSLETIYARLISWIVTSGEKLDVSSRINLNFVNRYFLFVRIN